MAFWQCLKAIFCDKGSLVTDQPTLNSPSASADNTSLLIQTTVTALQAAKGNNEALTAAITTFFTDAVAANIEPDEIENILGINEPSIMDLAELSEDDEEVVIDTIEQLLSSQ